MAVKKGYKQTEVGIIPVDWEVTNLATRVCSRRKITYGIVVPGPFVNSGIPMIRAQDYSRGWVDLDDLFRVSKVIDESYKRSRVLAEDVLLTIVGSVGNLAKVPPEFSGANLTQQTARLAFDRKTSSSDFFLYLLQSRVGKLQILNFTKSGVQPSLNLADVEKFLLPTPSLAEQEAIAGALSDADAWIESIEQLIAKKRQIKQGAMQELLTGKRRLPGFSGEWETMRLGDLGSTYGGLAGKTKSDFGAGDAFYVTFMNVMSNVVIDCTTFERVNVVASESQNRVLKNDILFNGSSETPEEVAMCAFVDTEVKDVYLNSFCFGFRLRDDSAVDGRFLAYYLRSNVGREMMKSLAQGSTRYNLSKTALLKAVLQLPCATEQTAIATLLFDMDTEIESLKSKLAKVRRIKQGMMQELLTGRIRLV